MMPGIQSKLPNTGVSIFTVMSALAAEHRAINLGQGSPDYNISPLLIELVSKAMRDGYNQYSHRNGFLALREAIAEKVEFLYKNNIDPSTEITITPGATCAIYTALTTVLKPGDEVIVFEPAYDSYVPGILINGAIPVLIQCEYPEYKIDWQAVKEKITAATKMIILNSPNNPTGQILDENDFHELRNIVQGTNILILSDEVYEHITFDGKRHESILKHPDLFQRSFAVFSFGKVYHCTGWKTGYCIAPEWMMKEFLKVYQFNAFCANTPIQHALAEYLRNRNEYLELGSFMQQKRDYFSNLMSQTLFEPIASHGSYFQLYGYSRLSNEREVDFAKKLTERAKVACIPVSAFYENNTDNRILRFCFAKKEDTLDEAVRRLISFQDEL